MSPVTLARATARRHILLTVDGAQCGSCRKPMRLGDRATVVGAGILAHRRGDPRCTPTVTGP